MMRKSVSLFLAWMCVLLLACGEQDNSVGVQSETGGYAFHLIFQKENQAAEVDPGESRKTMEENCDAIGVSSITVTLFNASNNKQADGTWGDCLAHGGVLKNIPVGSGYRAEFQGMNSAGIVTYTGTYNNISIVAGQDIFCEILMNKVDTTPPTISFTNPSQGSRKVQKGTDITVTFSEIMNADTINSETFLLYQEETTISGQVTVDGQTAIFNPNNDLSNDLSAPIWYSVTIKSTVQDLAGNAMGRDYFWYFTTASGPTITTTSPGVNATGVAVDTNISAVFSTLIYSNSIDKDSFLLYQGFKQIPGEVSYTDKTVTFNPFSDLLEGRVYRAIVCEHIMDTAGVPMGTDYFWYFTTVCNQNKTYTNTLGMNFQFICNGKFWMGSPDTEVDRGSDETLHQVTLTKSFYMQTTEVTQGQWVSIMGRNPSGPVDCGNNCPVEIVSWDDVQLFISALNQRGEGFYRLPSEAEWEYCARAGTTTPFSTGNCLSTDQANYDGNNPYSGCASGVYREKLAAVGSFPANPWGLYDMNGNVWEWCLDNYGDYPKTDDTDPTGPWNRTRRVLRGGSLYTEAKYCRSASRHDWDQDSGFSGAGFRLVREP